MDKTIQFTYSRKFGYSTTFLLSLLLFVMLYRLAELEDPRQIRIIQFFIAFLLVIVLVVVLKYLIPALKGKVAIELNDQGIVDNIRNATVHWKNIEQIRLVTFKQFYGRGIAIDLISDKAYLVDKGSWRKIFLKMNDWSFRTPLVIPLQFFTGDNSKIFETIESYFNKNRNCA